VILPQRVYRMHLSAYVGVSIRDKFVEQNNNQKLRELSFLSKHRNQTIELTFADRSSKNDNDTVLTFQSFDIRHHEITNSLW